MINHTQKPQPTTAQRAEVEQLSQTLIGASTFLRTQMAHDPRRTLGLAAGLGFVIGGGFWKVLVQPIVLTAVRVLLTSAAAGLSAQLYNGNHLNEEEVTS